MRTSDAIDQVAAAMAKAQGGMKPAAKDSANPFFKSKYADLASIWEACRGPLSDNGLSILQDVVTDGDSVLVTTRLAHMSGQWVEYGPLAVPLVKRDPQSVGSAISYGRRYALGAAIGIVADADDDAEAAMGRRPHPNGGETEPQTLAPEIMSEIMDVAKAQYGGRKFPASRVMAHLDGLAREQGASCLAQLDPSKAEAVIAAIREGGDPA